ncbi:MAG: KilA-N domain-containing protein [Firmicutes bacterium]|nr:KilA-N domain-containing protein [Bacillota bacterium]
MHPSDDYVSLTDIARKYDAANPSYLIQSWLRSRNTVEFLATWERKHNSNFNEDAFQRIAVDAKTPQFTLTPKKWIDLTNAIGIISKQGKSGGTMAHPFIVCDFEM